MIIQLIEHILNPFEWAFLKKSDENVEIETECMGRALIIAARINYLELVNSLLEIEDVDYSKYAGDAFCNSIQFITSDYIKESLIEWITNALKSTNSKGQGDKNRILTASVGIAILYEAERERNEEYAKNLAIRLFGGSYFKDSSISEGFSINDGIKESLIKFLGHVVNKMAQENDEKMMKTLFKIVGNHIQLAIDEEFVKVAESLAKDVGKILKQANLPIGVNMKMVKIVVKHKFKSFYGETSINEYKTIKDALIEGILDDNFEDSVTKENVKKFIDTDDDITPLEKVQKV
jgi:hypothetical protein